MAIRNQYVLGYYAKDPRNDGEYRHVTITLHPPKGLSDLHAYWRSGYYAPRN